jgi:hypothetical protein
MRERAKVDGFRHQNNCARDTYTTSMAEEIEHHKFRLE